MSCTLAITCGSPPDGSVGTGYTHTFPVTGSPSDSRYFYISTGALPPGLFLDPTTGIVSGTPTSAGTYSFTICVTDGQFVVAHDDGSSAGNIISLSQNGTSWTTVNAALSDSGKAVIYSQVMGLYIAGALFASSTDQIMTSPDAKNGNWTAVSTPADNDFIQALVMGSAKAVASYGSNGENIMNTPDGATWTTRSSPNGALVFAYSPSLGRIVGAQHAVSSPDLIMTSDDDGDTWTARSTPASMGDINALAWSEDAGLFVAMGGPANSGLHLHTSPDGITWTLQTNPDGHTWLAACFGGGKYVAVRNLPSGSEAGSSTDGIAWSIESTPTNKTWNSVTFGADVWCTPANSSGSTANVMLRDSSGTWTTQTTPTSMRFCKDVTFGPAGNCTDCASCSITIGGVTMGNSWRGGMQQRIGNFFG